MPDAAKMLLHRRRKKSALLIDPASVLDVLFHGDDAVRGAGGNAALAVDSWPAAVGGVTAANTGTVGAGFYRQPTQKPNFNNGHKGVYFDHGETALCWNGAPDGSRDSLTFTPAVTDAIQVFAVFVDETGHSNPETATGNPTIAGNNTNFAMNGGTGVRALDKLSHVNPDILTNGQCWFDGVPFLPKHAFRPRTIRFAVYQFANPTKFENIFWGTNGFDTEGRGTLLEWGLKRGAPVDLNTINGMLNFFKTKYTWGSKLPLCYAHGDSITDGPGNLGQLEWLCYGEDDLGPICDFINGGLFGELSDGGATRLSAEALYLADLDLPLKILTLMFGINDLNAGRSAASILANYASMAAAWKARDPARNKVLGLTTSRNGQSGRGGGDPTTYDASWNTVCSSLLASPATYNLDAVANCNAIPELVDTTNTTNYAGDDIHLRGPGQNLLYSGGTGSGMGIRTPLRTLIGV